MRILMLSDFYPPQVGGVEQHVRQLSQELASRGHRVDVASVAGAGAAGIERDGPVTVRRIRPTLARLPRAHEEASRPFAPPSPDPELMVGLALALRAVRPHVIHVHGWIGGSLLPLLPAAGAPVVTTLHDYGLVCAKKSLVYEDTTTCSGPGLGKCLRCASAHYGVARGVPIVLAEFLTSPVVRRATARFISVSRAVADANGVGSDSAIIPNFLPDEDPPEVGWSHWLDALPSGAFVLFVGALGGHKGLPILLEAYRRLASPPPLVLVGHRAPDTPRELPRGVVLLEDWPNGAVRAAWRRATVGVIPSTWPEPFGIVTLEAMAAGCPIVATRVGGLEEIVAGADGGLLVPPQDPGALAAAMERLLADEPERERLGTNGRRAVASYRASCVVPRIEAVYREAVGARSAGS